MKDFESRLRQLEVINQEQGNYQNMQKMKEKLSPVMMDIEKRLIALCWMSCAYVINWATIHLLHERTAGGNDARNTQSRIEKGSGEAFMHS